MLFFLLLLNINSSHAPWCPACKNLAPAWEQLATWSNDLNIKTAQIDVTTSPALSGRFLVTALPTIFQYVLVFIVDMLILFFIIRS